jgi:hypothetical protein
MPTRVVPRFVSGGTLEGERVIDSIRLESDLDCWADQADFYIGHASSYDAVDFDEGV